MALDDCSFPNLRTLSDGLILAVGAWTTYKLLQKWRSRAKTTKLSGPPVESWLFGLSRQTFNADSSVLVENWAKEYGPVFQVPGVLGQRRTVIMDPKALSHFFGNHGFGYVKSTSGKSALETLVGRGILWAEGEDHRRQRRTLSPAFSNAAIRNLTSIFYDSAYKCRAAWDAILSSSGEEDMVINVQKWMNAISLDTIGIAGFSHDFGALEGKLSAVVDAFESFGSAPPRGLTAIIPILGQVLPFLLKIPNRRRTLLLQLHESIAEIAGSLLERSRKEKEAGILGDSSRSIIGALLRAESSESELKLTEEEVLAQMKTLIFAGYETTSISLTWALIELAQNPDKQDALRKELAEFASSDPTYDQLTNALPYLNGVLRETLRLHPPLHINTRVAAQDDVIPLSAPITTSSGERVDHISVGKGTTVATHLKALNTSEEIWGHDAKEFKPERWLDADAGLTLRAREMGGYHHIMSFIDGPRMCLGRLFAVAEFKAVLSVLIRNYIFEMRDGLETKVEDVTTILLRPKVAGEEGYAMPMRVRRVE